MRIAPEAAAYVERWGGPPLAARVRRIDPAAFTKVSALCIEEQRVRAFLDFEEQAAESGALGDNFRVYVRIVEWRGEDVLQLPISSLFRNGEAWAVFRVEANRARLAPVEFGRRNARSAEILAGVSEGDNVVTYPGDRITLGASVVARDTFSREQ